MRRVRMFHVVAAAGIALTGVLLALWAVWHEAVSGG